MVKSIMNTIQKNELEGIELALAHIKPSLLPTLQKIIENGAFSPPPTGRGTTDFATFKPSSPVPPEDGQAILDALQEFSKREEGRDYHFHRMTIWGLINPWIRFIQQKNTMIKIGDTTIILAHINSYQYTYTSTSGIHILTIFLTSNIYYVFNSPPVPITEIFDFLNTMRNGHIEPAKQRD
jgi:hypothetical protein